MYSFAIGVSANDCQVYTKIINSAAGRCFSRQPHLVSLAKGVVESLELTEPTLQVTHDLGRTIGNTNIVATRDKDVIFYAQRLKQSGVLRFVKNRSMEPSSELSIILRKDSDGNYELTDIWIGPACPAFPGSADESEDSKMYWQTHALTADSESISSQSVTSVCPY
jgi:hypothetical protein